MPRDGLEPVNVERFAGLNLADDPEEVGISGAIDMADVELDRSGRIRSRDGLTTVYTIADVNTEPVARMLPLYGHNELMVSSVGGADKVYALDSSWSLVASQALTSSTGDMVTFGSGSNQYVYIADWGVALRNFNGTAFSTTAGTVPYPKWLAVQKPDNRLVAGYTNNGVADKSKVWFSNAGDPEVFNANDYVLLSPNDGGYITGLVTWREQLFAFKQDKFFVFYGNSTDASGNAIFNFRPVETGLGIAATQSAVAGREGVYFVNQHGIWLTTGGPPVKISGALDPLFEGVVPPAFSPAVTVANQDVAPGFLHRLGYALGRLYAHLYCSDSRIRTFIYDPESRQWTLWLGDLAYTIEYTTSGVNATRKIFGASSGLTTPYKNKIVYLNTAATTDDGTAISSFYRSGFGDLDQPGMEKTVRQTELVGQGTVQFSWARDLGVSMNAPSAANVTLGTAPATARKLHRNADYGELLGFKIASVNGGAWMVNRVVPQVQSVRPAGAMS